MIHTLYDPFTGKVYNYDVRDEKEARLFEALQLAVNDQCPPDNKDYLCRANEAEEQDCDACLLRYATLQFGKLKY